MTRATVASRVELDPTFSSLKEHIIASTGLAYYENKDADLAERIAPRLAHLSMNDCDAYLSLLRDRDAGEAERQALVGLLTIGETYFFRHMEQFDALRDVVFPDLIQRNQATRTLRIWSAGCAIGAEPYSIAILLKQHFAARIAGWNVQILGTDINRMFLARAERGEFDERALRSTSDEFKREWFTSSGTGWSVVPGVREWVSFRHHNLVEHPYPPVVHGVAALDLILCRNVMIYFDWAAIKTVLGHFHECLVNGGWLAVGHAESNPEAFQSYRMVNVPGATLYQKGGHAQARVALFAYPQPRQPEPSPSITLALPMTPTAPGHERLEDPAVAAAVPAANAPSVSLLRRLADEGKWQAASAACEALLQDDCLNPAVHFYQGQILEHEARDTEAEQAYRRALYLDRTCVLAHYHIAMLLKKRGDRPAAMQSLRNVLRLLATMRADDPIPHSEGLVADDLNRLTQMQLKLLT